MDKLDELKGIGRASAERLAKSGIDTFAKLAAATDEQLKAVENLPGDAKAWAAWREEAKTRLVPPRAMTAEELAALVKQWDDARAELKAAGDAVAALNADATVPADTLASAQARAERARSTIEALTPLPEGVILPPAAPSQVSTSAAAPASSPAAPQVPVVTLQEPPQANIAGNTGTLVVDDLVSGLARIAIRWQGKTHERGEKLTLPDEVASDLIARGHFAPF